ncbi:MAG: RNA polymerase sigma factor [Gammaproteobacteria bacterium]
MNPLKIYCANQDFKQHLVDSRPRLYRVAYSWCHQSDLADDLVQETLAKAMKHATQLRDTSALHSWLFGIMVNCWRDHLRKQKNLEDIDEVSLSHQDTPDRDYERKDIIALVQTTIAALPDGQRQVLSLVELGGFSYAEVADILTIPMGTVMSRLARARKHMADILLAQPRARDHIKTLRRVV